MSRRPQQHDAHLRQHGDAAQADRLVEGARSARLGHLQHGRPARVSVHRRGLRRQDPSADRRARRRGRDARSAARSWSRSSGTGPRRSASAISSGSVRNGDKKWSGEFFDVRIHPTCFGSEQPLDRRWPRELGRDFPARGSHALGVGGTVHQRRERSRKRSRLGRRDQSVLAVAHELGGPPAVSRRDDRPSARKRLHGHESVVFAPGHEHHRAAPRQVIDEFGLVQPARERHPRIEPKLTRQDPQARQLFPFATNDHADARGLALRQRAKHEVRALERRQPGCEEQVVAVGFRSIQPRRRWRIQDVGLHTVPSRQTLLNRP